MMDTMSASLDRHETASFGQNTSNNLRAEENKELSERLTETWTCPRMLLTSSWASSEHEGFPLAA